MPDSSAGSRSSLDVEADTDRSLSPLPPHSPSNSTFLRTAETLEGLARQLDHIKDDRLAESASDLAAGARCCCGAVVGCRTQLERERIEAKLKLSGEIGQALLQRYEALEAKYRRAEQQLEVKRKALAESVRHVGALERANATHLTKYADLSRKHEALEKRMTQSLHTQTLTQQSLTHVRTELAEVRKSSVRQSLKLVGSAEIQERLEDAEKRYEEARDQAEAETRKARDETRKRKRAEDRIAELEEQCKATAAEVETVKAIRAKDAQEVLDNAKDRLAELHAELSETFRTKSPADTPDYQRALEDLVASSALHKHNAKELSRALSESRDEARVLKDEVDELRSALETANATTRPLASELGRAEDTGSASSFAERAALARLTAHARHNSVAAGVGSLPCGLSAWEQHRRSSMAPSLASTGSVTDGLTSPGLGMGPIGEYGGRLDREGALSPPMDGRSSPSMRTSPSGGIPYHLNGVPKQRRPRPASRAYSDRRSSMRSFGVGSIAEWAADDEQSADTGNTTTEEPLSPATDYFRGVLASARSSCLPSKRSSVLLARTRATHSPYESVNATPTADTPVSAGKDTSDVNASPMSESGLTSPQRAKRVHRRTLLLLSRSRGVQTDPVEEPAVTEVESTPTPRTSGTVPSSATAATSPQPTDAKSETSSLHTKPNVTFAHLIDTLAKVLARLHDADVPTLHRRLRKARLPGDVGHLSRSTMRALAAEVAEIRHNFRGMDTAIDRREVVLLLKLVKEVFTDLIELQSVVNAVTLDPSAAKKLQKDAYRDDEADAEAAASAGASAGGLGWIAAPITKFFVTPTDDDGTVSARAPRGRPAAPRAPKQSPSTSATTTHVSVEFGGAGIVRRATPAPLVHGQTAAHIPPSPITRGDETMRAVSAPAPPGLAPPAPTVRQLRPQRSRANRSELLGLFAGAAPAQPESSWVVLPPHAPSRATSSQSSSTQHTPAVPKLRAAPSQYFSAKAAPAGPVQPHERKRMSALVDAVIDHPAANDGLAREAGFDGLEGSYEPGPPLLERTLRPRGLSDSSIRSTIVSHAATLAEQATHAHVPVPAALAAPARPIPLRAGAYAYAMPSMLESLSRKLYAFRGAAEQDPSPARRQSVSQDKDGSRANESDTPPRPAPTPAARSLALPIPSPSKAAGAGAYAASPRSAIETATVTSASASIPASIPSASPSMPASVPPATSLSASVLASTGHGLLSMIVGMGKEMDEEEAELDRAAHRQARSPSRSRGWR
ncbi:hypothetical protein Q5752_001803 [Cryptotrichosporon argae]